MVEDEQGQPQFKKPPVPTSVKVADELGTNVEREFLRFLQEYAIASIVVNVDALIFE
jgi:hypothetical protein